MKHTFTISFLDPEDAIQFARTLSRRVNVELMLRPQQGSVIKMVNATFSTHLVEKWSAQYGGKLVQEEQEE